MKFSNRGLSFGVFAFAKINFVNVCLRFFAALCIFIFLLLLYSGKSYAVVRTWDGEGTDGTCGGGVGDGEKWSCDANWSDDTQPGSSDIATFSSTSTKNSNIDSGFAGSVAGIDINSGYTGIITANTGLAIGSSNFDQAAGTFDSTSQTIDLNGAFTLSAGTFTATSETMTISSSLTISGSPVFSAGGGTITFDGTTTSVYSCNSVTFNAINISKGSSSNSVTISSNCTFPIAGTDPSTTAAITNNGTIDITGNWTHNGGYISNTGAFLIMTGTSVTFTGGVITLNGGTFPAGVTTLSVGDSLNNTGNVLPNGIDLTLTNTSGDDTLTCGTVTWNSVTISKGLQYDMNIGSSCVLPIAGTNPTTTAVLKNNGTINITGNWTHSGPYTQNAGSFLTVTGTSITAGTLILNGGTFPAGITTLSVAGDLYNATNLLPNGIDLTLTDSLGDDTLTCGTVTWNSVTLSKASTHGITFTSSCIIPIAGTNPSTSGAITNNGTINITGNWTSTGSYTSNVGAELIMTGTTITLTGNLTLNGGTFPSITTLSVTDSINNSGNVLPDGIDLTLNSSLGDDTLTCGTVTWDSMTINKGGSDDLALNDSCAMGDLTVIGTLILNPASAVSFTVTGNFSQTGGTFGGANLTIDLTGSAAQTLSMTGGTFSSVLRINKTGSNAASLISGFRTSSQTCTVVEGIFDTNGYSFDCGSTFTVEDGGTLRLVGSDPIETPTLNTGTTVTYKGDGDGSAESFPIRDWPYKNLTVLFTDASDTLDAPTSDTLTSSEVGYWKMNEGSGTVEDSSTNNNTATPTNAVFTATAPDIEDTNPFAMDFDGAGDYLNMGDSLNLAQNISVFTMAAWIRKDSNSGVDQIFGLSTGDSTADTRAGFATSGDELQCFGSAGDTEAVQTKTTSATNLITGLWYHVVCTIDYTNDTVTMYLNSVSQSATGTITFTATSTSNTASQRSSIGIDEDKSGNDYDGQIDEVRVYTRALTQNEMNALSAGFTTMAISSRTVTDNVTVSGGTFVSPTTLNIGGNFTNSANFTHNSGLVNFNGTSGTKTLTSGGDSFNDLTINDGGGSLTLELQDPLDVDDDLTITGGTLDTKSGVSNQINVGGDWSNSDTFTPRSGSVVLDGGDQSISGTTIFTNLTKNITTPARTLTFPASVAQTITGTMNLSGTLGNLLSLRSSITDTQAQIDPQGTRTISYLDVKDNYNVNSTFIETSGFNITNSLNNTGWDFNAPSATAPTSISQATDGTGYITFSTTVSETDSQDTRLKVEYSDDAGTSWYDLDLVSATPSGGSVSLSDSDTYQVGQSNPIDTSTGSITLTVVWDTKSSSNGNGSLDDTNQTDIRVRVTPSDFSEDGSVATSSSFEVDNLDPSGLSGLTATSTSTTAPLTWAGATEANFNHYEIWYGTNQTDVEARSGTASEWDNSDDTDLTNVSATSTIITGLTTGSTYYFRIWAIDNFGNEAFAATISKLITGPATSDDTTDPESFDLILPDDKSYINDQRPTFKWEGAIDDDGLDSYTFSVDNGASGDFKIENIKPSGTKDKKTSSYVISYSGFNTSSDSDDKISLYTKSSGSWGSGNDGKLKEGKRRWTVKAIDDADNDRTESSTVFVDLTGPTVNLNRVDSSNASGSSFDITSQRPTFYGKITDPLNGDSEQNEVAVGPKEVKLTIEKKGALGTYSTFLISNINISDTFFSSDGSEVTDNTKNTSDKYSDFSYRVNEDMPYGDYRITLSGKDELDNEGESKTFNLTISEPPPVPTPTPTPTPIPSETVTPTVTPSETPPPSIIEPITPIIEDVVDAVTDLYWDTVDTVTTVVTTVADGLADAISLLPAELIEFAGNLLSPIQPVIDQLVENIVITAEVWFDRDPTIISDVKVIEVGTDYAVIYWKTNHHATSKVNYGLSYDYGSDVYSKEKTTEHKLKITGLKPGTIYYYEVMSQNKNYVFDARHEFETTTSGSELFALVPETKEELRKPTLIKRSVDSLKKIPLFGRAVTAIDDAFAKRWASALTLATSVTLLNLPSVYNFTQIYLTAISKIPIYNIPYALFGLLKKKRHPWGVVYDSVTKQPLDPAVITLKDTKTGQQVQGISDIYGRYEFIVEPGAYSISVAKSNYVFPSKVLSEKSFDEVYEDIYLGESFVLMSHEKVNFNIPMDNISKDWNEEEKRRLKIAGTSRMLYKVTSLTYKLGFLISLLIYLMYPNLPNLSVIVLFGGITIFRRIRIKIKPWGIVARKDGKPVSNAVVRLINIQIPKLKLPPIVTNILGRYNFLVDKGIYQITVSLKRDDGTYQELYKSRPISMTRKYGQVNEDIILPKFD